MYIRCPSHCLDQTETYFPTSFPISSPTLHKRSLHLTHLNTLGSYLVLSNLECNPHHTRFSTISSTLVSMAQPQGSNYRGNIPTVYKSNTELPEVLENVNLNHPIQAGTLINPKDRTHVKLVAAALRATHGGFIPFNP